MKVVLAVLIALAASAASAQSQVRVLLPVFIGETAGAGGSYFESRFAGRNFSNTTTTVRGLYPPCQLSGRTNRTSACPAEPGLEVSAGETFGGSNFLPPFFGGNPGYALILDPDAVEVVLRIVTDFNPTGYYGQGTQVPVVREDQFFNSKFDLLDIPSEAGYRFALRIYSFQDTSVIVKVYDPSFPTDRLVSEKTIAVAGAFPPFVPAVGQIFGDLGGAGLGEGMRIEIDPTGAPVWAVASMTDNYTQQITIVTPARH